MPTLSCTNEILVAVIALIVAVTALVNLLIAYVQSRQLVKAVNGLRK